MTHRRLAGGRLVVASHNPGKTWEIATLLDPLWGDAVSAGALGLPGLADDSGLVVAALGGAPGIHSARWAGPDRDFGAAMRRVRRELAARGVADGAAAQFVCALALCWPDGPCATFGGTGGG